MFTAIETNNANNEILQLGIFEKKQDARNALKERCEELTQNLNILGTKRKRNGYTIITYTGFEYFGQII